MQEFYASHHKVMNEDPEYLIIVLLEDLNVDGLPADLQTFMRTHTYIEAQEYDLQTLRKRIRFSMPHRPLASIKKALGRVSMVRNPAWICLDVHRTVPRKNGFLHWVTQVVSGLKSKFSPLGPMLNFDADVKKTTARHECENPQKTHPKNHLETQPNKGPILWLFCSKLIPQRQRVPCLECPTSIKSGTHPQSWYSQWLCISP